MLDLHGISRASFDLVVAKEVTSQAVYEKKYRHAPEYPGEQSGPTGGIGYDFAMLNVLLGASGKRGEAAAAYCRATRG